MIEPPNADYYDEDDSPVYAPNFSPTEEMGLPKEEYKDGCKDKDCIICLDTFQAGEDASVIVSLKCKHTFHAKCIDDWLKKQARCPLCREEQDF